MREYYLVQVIKEICNDQRKPYNILAKPIFTEQLQQSKKEGNVLNPVHQTLLSTQIKTYAPTFSLQHYLE